MCRVHVCMPKQRTDGLKGLHVERRNLTEAYGTFDSPFRRKSVTYATFTRKRSFKSYSTRCGYVNSQSRSPRAQIAIGSRSVHDYEILEVARQQRRAGEQHLLAVSAGSPSTPCATAQTTQSTVTVRDDPRAAVQHGQCEGVSTFATRGCGLRTTPKRTASLTPRLATRTVDLATHDQTP